MSWRVKKRGTSRDGVVRKHHHELRQLKKQEDANGQAQTVVVRLRRWLVGCTGRFGFFGYLPGCAREVSREARGGCARRGQTTGPVWIVRVHHIQDLGRKYPVRSFLLLGR